MLRMAGRYRLGLTMRMMSAMDSMKLTEAVEESRVPARVVAEQDAVAGAAPGRRVVACQEAARRCQPGLVGDGGRQDGEEEQPLARLLHQLIIHFLASASVLVQRDEDDMDHHIDKDGTCQGHGVNGVAHIPAASSSIGADEAEQVQYHDCLEDMVL